MIIVDQGSDFKSTSRKIRELEASFDQNLETRSATKKKFNFKDYVLSFTDREKAKLKSSLGKLSCMLLFHPPNSSFLTACENLINQFRRTWEKSNFNSITLDLFQFQTCVRLTNMALNKQPLFLIRQSDTSCYEICAQDLFNGRVSGLQGETINNVHPLTADNALSELSVLGKQMRQAFETFHSERFHKLSTFYKDNKNPQFTKLLKRPLEKGDICLFSQRGSPILKLCAVIELSPPGVADYSQSSEAEVEFLPQNYEKVKDDLSAVWKRATTRVHISNLAPIMSKEQRFLDFTVLPDHLVSEEQLQEINSEIEKIKNQIPAKTFWSKLLSRNILAAPLSRILINESNPTNPDPYYQQSRRVLSGLEEQRDFPKAGAKPNEILKNLLPKFEKLTPGRPLLSTPDTDSMTEDNPKAKPLALPSLKDKEKLKNVKTSDSKNKPKPKSKKHVNSETELRRSPRHKTKTIVYPK